MNDFVDIIRHGVLSSCPEFASRGTTSGHPQYQDRDGGSIYKALSASGQALA
jgi:hypothetical protein